MSSPETVCLTACRSDQIRQHSHQLVPTLAVSSESTDWFDTNFARAVQRDVTYGNSNGSRSRSRQGGLGQSWVDMPQESPEARLTMGGVAVAVGYRTGEVSLWSLDFSNVPPSSDIKDSANTPTDLKTEDMSRSKVGSDSGSQAPRPTRRLELRQVMRPEAHSKNIITALRFVGQGQELLVGDSGGNVSRWASTRLDHVNAGEVTALVV